MAGKLPEGWQEALPVFSSGDGALATRIASGKVLNAIVGSLPTLVGGSADLASSTNTLLKGYGDLGIDGWSGRNVRFGVREHAMGGIVNGMALHGGMIPFGATFLVFSDYLRPAIRLAALMGVHSIFVFTHDSIGVGGDGPTHQPIEHLPSLRAIPGLTVLRPADANETAASWRLALERDGPSVLALTRQGVPVIDDAERVRAGVPRGAYVLADADSGQPDVVLLATGSEVALILAARELLAGRGLQARVVSMPSWEVFEEQDEAYKEAVLPPSVPARLAVEAAVPMGWERYVGAQGAVIGIDRFGASASGELLFEKFGFTPEAVAERAAGLVQREAK